MPLQPALEDALKLMEHSLTTADFKEGVQSFVEQRPPRFKPLP
jgi:enoyl-CoA hydratase/carnithine racemase